MAELPYIMACKFRSLINEYGVEAVFDAVWQMCPADEEDKLLEKMKEITSLSVPHPIVMKVGRDIKEEVVPSRFEERVFDTFLQSKHINRLSDEMWVWELAADVATDAMVSRYSAMAVIRNMAHKGLLIITGIGKDASVLLSPCGEDWVRMYREVSQYEACR